MIENKKADLPSDILSLYRTKEQIAISLMDKNDFSLAEQEYKTILSEIFKAQGSIIRYHKGGVYHQIGICLYYQKKHEEALTYFKYAFIEDCLSEIGFVATQFPAYRVLNQYYKISATQLIELSNKIKYDINTDIPLNAENYLKNYLDGGGKLDSISAQKNNCVFVGGNYKNIALLRYISNKVSEYNFSSIMAIDFDVPKNEDIYSHAMALLQDCGSAIFEITFDSGHLMEIERAINTKLFPSKNILLLFQIRKNNDEHFISKMLLGFPIVYKGYMNIDEIPGLVKNFLEKLNK
ncbi:hypothetical protein HY745_04545 [Candidatus Desantisbacteria bacterium]|nr:hypothetical protein [Candidatus Desantisbacteria bacterium]